MTEENRELLRCVASASSSPYYKYGSAAAFSTPRISSIFFSILFIAVVFLCTISFAYAATEAKLENPIKFPDISQFVAGALRVLVIVALPIISFFIVYSGFLFVFARGNQEKLSQARYNFMFVIVGAILILGAWVLATILGGTVAQLTN